MPPGLPHDSASSVDAECASYEQAEVGHIQGKTDTGAVVEVQLIPDGSAARNDAFDVTPARYITGLITERGVVAANRDAIGAMFPERIEAT